MPIDKIAHAFVPRTEQMKGKKLDMPYEEGQCQCPAPCIAAKTTIDALKRTGMPYKFHCTKCCPDELRESVQAMSDYAKTDPTFARNKPIPALANPGKSVIFGVPGQNLPDLISQLEKLVDDPSSREHVPVEVTMTLDVGEWVDILTTLEMTAVWLKTAPNPTGQQHPRGPSHMDELARKVGRMVKFEIQRQVKES